MVDYFSNNKKPEAEQASDIAEDGLQQRPVAASKDDGDAPSGKAEKPTQPVRAINEDDDGYDPYSDLHDRPAPEPLFERDPWN